MKVARESTVSSTPTAGPAPVLEAEHLCRRFGGMRAVDDVSLSVRAGEILGIIGPNGAGKSTLFDLLAGAQRADDGTIRLRGRRVEREGAERRLAAGLGRTFQIPRPFAALSLLENVLLGACDPPGERLWPNWFTPARVATAERAAAERAREVLTFLDLGALAMEPARVLSGGQRKLLELARVLMAAPAVVLLDEPAAGVHPALVAAIGAKLKRLAAEGLAVVIIEHHLGLIESLCSRVVVMAEGRVLCEGTPSEVLGDPRVAEAYVGRPAA